jgi:hypothetical protein
MATIDVSCSAVEGGWSCDVRVTDRGGETRHSVAVSRADLERFAPSDAEPAALVRRSFEFLLARESKESILRSFALPVIGRYFPEYEREILRE